MTTPTMPLNGAFPNNYVSEQSSIDVSYATLTASFGDGYIQSADNGINIKRKLWNVTFTNLTETNYTTISDFLDTVKGTTSFYATPRGETQQLWRLIPTSVKVTTVIVNKNTGEVYRHLAFQLNRVYQ
jgi:phage-related protein